MAFHNTVGQLWNIDVFKLEIYFEFIHLLKKQILNKNKFG